MNVNEIYFPEYNKDQFSIKLLQINVTGHRFTRFRGENYFVFLFFKTIW